MKMGGGSEEGRQGGRRGGHASNGRGGRTGDNRRPQAIDELKLVYIEEYPVGVPLETPLHPKRRRRRCRSSSPSVSSFQSDAEAKPAVEAAAEFISEYIVVKQNKSSPSEAPYDASPGPPSSAMYVESIEATVNGASTPQTSGILHTCSPQIIPEADVSADINDYGSDPDSENDDEKEAAAAAMVPRMLRGILDTPLDDDGHDYYVPLDDFFDAAQPPHQEPPVSDAVYQPNGFYDFHWTSFPNPPTPPEFRRETFSETNVGPTAPCDDPYKTFIAIWDRRFMEHIAKETNRYAQSLKNQSISDNFYPNSRFCDWYDTSVDELYVYFALVLAMGVVVKSRIEEYWSDNGDIFSTPGFSTQMSCRRFQLLNKCLHFNNNEDMCEEELNSSEAKLFKIQPVLSHLNEKFQTLYNMRQNIALDESLLHRKGWFDNQFLPNKTATGIKTYELCESETGYLWRFEIHAHNNSVQETSDPLDAITPAIVLKLIKGLENKGHTLWMNSFYNSPALARRLKSLGFDCVGTLQTNRQYVPSALNNLTKDDMKPGQIAGLTSGDVDLWVWRDQNRVAMISTYHSNAVSLADENPKPILFLDYNMMMGGVDKKDQMLAMYPEKKRPRVWYKKLFRRLLNVSVLNSYILVKQSSSSIPHRSFRLNLIKSLLEKHGSAPVVASVLLPKKIFDVKLHHLAEYPREGRQYMRRLCCVCKKRAHLYCVGCKKNVCMTPCFPYLHQ